MLEVNLLPLIQQAFEQAQLARLLSPPNPSVGAVIATADGRILGQGHTQRAGGPHAEIMALREAQALGHNVIGATAYVTLEPCSHHGRTGPCCDALIAAGIAKVVALASDPNPLVAGQGFARLQQAGVAIELIAEDVKLARSARELNLGYFSRMQRKTPWVRMKLAASLDGTTALENGQSQWITSAPARADGHAWRARACAVLTGIGTVLEDNPRLDVRLVSTPRQPHIVVIDSRLETPINAALFATEQASARQYFIYCAIDDARKRSALEARGVSVIALPNTNGKVDLTAVLRDLAAREVNELHLEAGHKLNGSFVREGLVDEFLLYLAPQLLGPGRGMAAFGPLTSLQDALELEFTDTTRIGPDLRIRARVAGRTGF